MFLKCGIHAVQEMVKFTILRELLSGHVGLKIDAAVILIKAYCFVLRFHAGSAYFPHRVIGRCRRPASSAICRYPLKGFAEDLRGLM